MKSKLVRYPFNDGKRYRWDTYQMGKKFEYTWGQSEPQNYETITPYFKYEPIVNDGSKRYGYIDFSKDTNYNYVPSYQDITYTPSVEWRISDSNHNYKSDFSGRTYLTDVSQPTALLNPNQYQWARVPMIYEQTDEEIDFKNVFRLQILTHRAPAFHPYPDAPTPTRIEATGEPIWPYRTQTYFGENVYSPNTIYYCIELHPSQYGDYWLYHFFDTQASAQTFATQNGGLTVNHFSFWDDFILVKWPGIKWIYDYGPTADSFGITWMAEIQRKYGLSRSDIIAQLPVDIDATFIGENVAYNSSYVYPENKSMTELAQIIADITNFNANGLNIRGTNEE